jgi:hypothetical protein
MKKEGVPMENHRPITVTDTSAATRRVKILRLIKVELLELCNNEPDYVQKQILKNIDDDISRHTAIAAANRESEADNANNNNQP